MLEIFLLQSTRTITRQISLGFIRFVVLFYVRHYFTSQNLEFTTSHIPLSLHYILFVSCPAVCKPYLQCLSVVSIQYFRCLADPSGRAISCWDCRSESRRGHRCLSLVSGVCCQVEVSVSGPSLIQRNPSECGVSEFDREASILRRPWPTGAVGPRKKFRLNTVEVFLHRNHHTKCLCFMVRF